MFDAYRRHYPELADQSERMFRRQLPEGWDNDLPTFPADPKGLATRDSSGQVLNALSQECSVADRGSRGLGSLDQDPSDLCRGRRFFSRES